MKRKIISLTCLFLLLSISYISGEEKPISGDLSLGVRTIHLQKDSAKFYEYNGLKNGPFGDLFLIYDSEKYSTSVIGENIGLDDQSYIVEGGKWGAFKYSLYFDEIPHNYSFRTRTFYSDPGSDNLTYSFTTVPTNSDQWSSRFDYSIKRKDFGGSFDLTMNSPFFVTLGINQLQREGLFPIGAPSGVFRTGATSGSPFGNVTEMPAPIDNTTTNVSLETGYKMKSLFLSLGGSFSTFNNQNEWLTFRNPYVTNQSLSETISLPPDNKYYNVKFAGMAKLPLNSTLGLNAGFSRLTSDVSLLDTIWSSSLPGPTYSLVTLGLNDKTFSGDISYKNLSTVLTSTPFKALTTKLFYKFLKKDNDSDEITYTYSGQSTTNHLFEYKKHNAGLDLGYKFTKDLKATVGYDYLKVKREREDIPETKDDKYFAELKYHPFDFLGTSIKYQRLDRSAKFESPGVASTDRRYIENFVRRFDATDKNQDAIKLSVDLSPLDRLDLTAEYAYKKDDYDDTLLGLTKAKRNEFILDASYEIRGVRLYGYFDYEVAKRDITSRYINPTGVYSFDPNTVPVANSYNWDVKLKDKNYALGVGFEVPIIAKKLLFGTQYDFEKANGNADFTSQILTGTLTQDSIDIPLYDDYKRHVVLTKLKYNYKDKLNLILGYEYQRLKYTDAQFEGYRYVMPVTGTTNTYLTGAYKDEPYNANILYLKAVYKF